MKNTKYKMKNIKKNKNTKWKIQNEKYKNNIFIILFFLYINT
jgi:hypothetical protein